MRLLWKAGTPMRFNASTGAYWNGAAPPPPPPPPITPLQAISGGFRVNSVETPPSTPTLAAVQGGFTVS